MRCSLTQRRARGTTGSGTKGSHEAAIDPVPAALMICTRSSPASSEAISSATCLAVPHSVAVPTSSSEVELTLAEVATGVSRDVAYTVADACATCDGTGAEPGSEPAVCPICGGLGQVQTVGQSLLGRVVRQQVCAECSGGGKIVTDKCRTCRGHGRVEGQRDLEVDVPAGIHDGQRIRLSSRGHVGDGGQRPGDLFVHVHVADDPNFVRQGDDLVTRLDVSMVEAALGGAVMVPTLNGDHELELEPGTQPGTVKVLGGLGMPVLRGHGQGDQHVIVNVRVPRRLDDESRHLLEQLDARIDDSSYDEDEGFFDRLKAVFR